MSNLFVDEFNCFLNTIDEDAKRTLLFLCVNNADCNHTAFDNIIQLPCFSDIDKQHMKYNFEGNLGQNRVLTRFTQYDKEQIVYLMKKLDGTLLSDLLYDIVKKKKIFI
jgi:hypothetical protein